MSNPLAYRSSRPELSSSSPLANLQDLSSSEPLSPGSPTPAFRRSIGSASTTATLTSLDSSYDSSQNRSKRTNAFLLSPNNSHPDPFSGNAKASPNSHPSFGKDQMRAKHLRNSPNANALFATTSSSPSWQRDDQILGRHFHDSSDDHPSSDDVGEFSLGKSTSNAGWEGAGLGIRDSSLMPGQDASSVLGAAFQEPTSPTLGKKPRARTFERTQSSSHDPFSAIGGSSIRPPHSSSSADRSYPTEGSPRAQVIRQRRRLAGSSPQQLTRIGGKFANHTQNGNGSDSDEQTPRKWERVVSGSYLQQQQHHAVNIPQVISNMMGKGEPILNLEESDLSSIDPSIADLSKYVRIPNLRRDDELSRPAGGFSRTSSLVNAERLAGSPINSPSRNKLSSSGANNKLELYLAKNNLRTISSALFSVTNLTVLSVRGNKLKELPPAIGDLKNLTELNVSSNELRYFPSEIQKLRLTKFAYFPNKNLFKPSQDARLSVRASLGLHNKMTVAEIRKLEEEKAQAPSSSIPGSMGPPALPFRSRPSMPSQPSFASGFSQGDASTSGGEKAVQLIVRAIEPNETVLANLTPIKELCIRALLQPDGERHQGGGQSSSNNGKGTATMLDRYEAGSVSNMRYKVDRDEIKTLEAARRSAAGVWGQFRISSDRWCSGEILVKDEIPTRSRHSRTTSKDVTFDEDATMMPDEDGGEASGEMSSTDDERQTEKVVDVEAELDKGDDAMRNPWFNRCPNPRHKLSNEAFEEDEECDWPPNDISRVFGQPCVQRIEWVSHIGGFPVINKGVYKEALAADALQNSPPSNSQEKDASPVPDKRPLAQGSDCLPILWRGCMRGCLNFLEDAAN
ncbi:uncharacterized protein FA14DRAFT_170008 [Meira miltonrushii]|uniref:L domain-like protein n=1 Tax=Meira miltonrushii TaxID=1280837 RepID=A0A316VHW0_9BASI|nr:uncharacterized protein FA14DRAFT_170008 [Meira miltonrushii]PWN37120.1 hypothetical protein FA14DRAFT_170008 [Meira miltonrushii]